MFRAISTHTPAAVFLSEAKDLGNLQRIEMPSTEPHTPGVILNEVKDLGNPPAPSLAHKNFKPPSSNYATSPHHHRQKEFQASAN
jgi:hypothetical protein